MGLVTVGHILHTLPEVRHGGIGIVAAHGPDRVGIGASKQYVLDIFQREDTIVLEQHYRLTGDVIGRLALLRRVELDVFGAVQVGILVEESCTELMTEHILHSTLQRFWLYETLVDGFLQVLIVGTEGEVDIIAAIDGCGSFLDRCLQTGYLVDGSIVAHYHTVEAHVASQDVLQNLTVGHALRAVHLVIAWHHGFAARQANHRLVGQEYLFHHLFLVGITATAVA